MVKLLHLPSNTDQAKPVEPAHSLMQSKFNYLVPGKMHLIRG